MLGSEGIEVSEFEPSLGEIVDSSPSEFVITVGTTPLVWVGFEGSMVET